MRLKSVVLSVLMLFTLLAYANDDKKKCVKPTPKPPVHKPEHEGDDDGSKGSSSTSSSSNSANAVGGSSTSTSVSTSSVGNVSATGGQGGNATASNGAQQNSQTANTYYNQVRQAPPAFAPEAFSTAPCRVAGSAGVSAPFGGLALGGSKKDKDCERVQIANGFFARNNPVAGCKLLLSVKSIKAAITMEECLATVEVPAPVAPVVVQPAPVPPVTVIVQAPAPIVQAEKPTVVTVRPAVRKPRVSHTCPVTVDKQGVKHIQENK